MHEQLLASGRLASRIGASPSHEQPLLATGELGAATVPYLVAYAAGLFRARAADAARLPALVIATSDGEPRAALVITRPEVRRDHGHVRRGHPEPGSDRREAGAQGRLRRLDVLGETELLRAAPRFDRRGVVDRLRGALGDLFVAKDAIEG